MTQGSREMIEVNIFLPHLGRPINLSLKLSPLKDSENHTMGIAIVLDDLTELKQRDETLNVVRTYLSDEMVQNIESLDKLGLGGEEREISVLFGDVRGFTTFSENLEPEVLMEVINKYLSTSSVAIQLLGGIIDKYMGDAVVGLYNTQLNPQENHAELAVRTAMAIVNDVEGLHSVLPEDQRLFYGLGVHSGKAMLGNVGSPSRKEFTALGEATTYAKKLQEVAQKGEVLISEETYHQVKEVIKAELTQRQLRGSGKTVNVYKVVDVL
jgi:adenylate cyclase